MIYVLTIFILLSEYYTVTYGLMLLKQDRNVLGGVATIIVGGITTIVTIVMLFIKHA